MAVVLGLSTQAQIIVNTCPATTGDLTTHVNGTPPAGTTITFHSGTPATDANKLTTAQAQAAPVGTYYAAYYDATNACYSPTSSPLYVAKCVKNTCPSTTVNLTSFATGSGTIEWHDGNPVSSGNKVADPTAVGAGTYWAVYFDAVNNCYSPVSTPVVVTITPCLIISGTVFIDPNGATPDGTPYSAGDLYVNIIGSDGKVVATVAVAANGTYSVPSLPPGTYTVQINKIQGVVGTAAPAQQLPGTFVNSSSTDGTPLDGQTSVTLSTANVTDVNFGVQNGPVAVDDQVTDQNPGAVSINLVSNDTDAGGTVDASTVSLVPPPGATNIVTDAQGNVVSFEVHDDPISPGTVTGTWSVNQSGLLTYTPANSYNNVAPTPIQYTVQDNLGAVSNQATVTITYKPHVTLGGSVFNDNNGLTDDTVNGTYTGLPTNLYATLLSSTGAILQTVPVVNGNYLFESVNGNSSYTVVLTTNSAGSTTASLPPGWFNTGENLGTAAGNDGTPPNGMLAVTIGTTDIIHANFGINQPPTATTYTAPPVDNPTSSYTIPQNYFGGTDPNNGSIASMTITSFPANAESITINGTTYTAANFPVGGVTIPTTATGYPTQTITVNPVSGNTVVTIPYTTTDIAGLTSTTSGTLSIPFKDPVTNPDMGTTYAGVPLTGSLATNDASGLTYGTPTVPSGVTNPSSAMPTVNPDGTYSFSSTVPGTYQFLVPVCEPGGTVCTNEILTITVEPAPGTTGTYSPVVNPDVATVAYYSGTGTAPSVTVNILANDAPMTPGTTLGTPTLGTVPAGTGTATIDANGNLVFTPAAGFYGEVTIPYTVCEVPDGTNCRTTSVVITVPAPTASNSTQAADDFAVTTGQPVTISPLANDTDAEGNTQTLQVPASGQPGSSVSNPITIPGKGAYYYNASGQIVFIPAPGYTGPVDIPYTVCDNGTPSACTSATIHILVKDEQVDTNPDMGTTYAGVALSGNLSTNDAPGLTYGTPTVPTGVTNPSSAMPTVNANGTYSFTSTVPGIYQFLVPVCEAATNTCTNEILTITVEPAVTVAGAPQVPVVNPDVASVAYYSGTGMAPSVTVNILANDAAMTPGTTLGTPTLGAVPAGTGTATIDANGNLVFTPAAGFYGEVTIPYTVCEVPDGTRCSTTSVVITVPAPTAGNTTQAADDFAVTTNLPVIINPLLNDTDPEGNTQTVQIPASGQPGSSQFNPIVIPGVGYYYWTSDTHELIFTPLPGYAGPVEIPYTVCDNGTPQDCATATIHILVKNEPISPNPDVNVGYVNNLLAGSVATNDNLPTLPNSGSYVYGTPTALSSPAGSTATLTMNPNGTYTFTANTPGVYEYVVPVCVSPATTPPTCTNDTLTITIMDPTSGAIVPPVLNTDYASTSGTNPVTLYSLSNDQPGTNGSALVPSTFQILDANGNVIGDLDPNTATTNTVVFPGIGTLVINADGSVTFTPAAGYTGTFSYTYHVCDNQTPPQCATATQQITVEPSTVDVLNAADDYTETLMDVPLTVPASAGVLANDSNPDPDKDENIVVTTTGSFTLYDASGAVAGTLVMNANGSYTFTPASGWTGTTNFTYTVCEVLSDPSPALCRDATLYITVNKPDGALPVELISLAASPVNCNISINWKSGAETNLARYVVERSTDSRNFTAIYTVNAKGNNSNYMLVDMAAVKGTNYYRLRMIDADGIYSISNIVKAEISCDKLVTTVTPTLTTGIINVNGLKGRQVIYITNSIGQVVLKVDSRMRSEQINISHFAGGIYNVVVRNDDGSTQTFRVMKK